MSRWRIALVFEINATNDANAFAIGELLVDDLDTKIDVTLDEVVTTGRAEQLGPIDD